MKKIIPIIVVVLFSYIFYIIFTQASISAKSKRVQCQNKTTTFEKISVEEPVKEAVNLLLSNNYTISSHMEYSKYMKSHLVEILSKKQADKKLSDITKKYIKTLEPKNENLSINYYIYENDKDDLGKKGTKSKLYAGYLVFEFKLGDILIYKIQTDYMDIDGKDIDDRMECAVESFVSITN